MPIEKLFTIKSRDIDTDCKDLSDLHIANKLDLETLLATAKPITTSKETTLSSNDETSKSKHVIIGEQLIKELHLINFNGILYLYQNGVYKEADTKVLKSYIIKNININTEDKTCKAAIDFAYNWLLNDEQQEIDDNYINYLNGIYDIKNGVLLPHTPEIITFNQVHINYIPDFNANIENPNIRKNEFIFNETDSLSKSLTVNIDVDTYLDAISNYDFYRKLALLELIGYCQTSSTWLQKAIILLGNGANGKSEFGKILIKTIGEENTSHVDLQTLERQFR